MSTVVQRIKQFIDSKGISIQRFEKLIGYSNGAFGSQLKNNRNVGSDKLENILIAFPDISPTWLLTGDGPMLKSEKKAEPPGGSASPPDQSGNKEAFYKELYKEKEKELKEAYYEIGRLNALVEQLKKDTNKANYAPGTSELERKK